MDKAITRFLNSDTVTSGCGCAVKDVMQLNTLFNAVSESNYAQVSQVKNKIALNP